MGVVLTRGGRVDQSVRNSARYPLSIVGQRYGSSDHGPLVRSEDDEIGVWVTRRLHRPVQSVSHMRAIRNDLPPVILGLDPRIHSVMLVGYGWVCLHVG